MISHAYPTTGERALFKDGGVGGDFPGGLVAKTLHSQYRDPGFDPWSRN